MYKVQNTMPGNLPIDLEQGSITLTSGQTFDLDSCCSRKWIKANVLLKRLFAAGALRLVHDSANILPKAPTKKVGTPKPAVVANPIKHAPPKPTAPKAPKKPKIIDLKDKETPTEKKYKKPTYKSRKKKEEDPVEKSLKSKKEKEEKPKRSYSRKSSKKKAEADSEKKTKKKRTYTRKKSSKKYDD